MPAHRASAITDRRVVGVPARQHMVAGGQSLARIAPFAVVAVVVLGLALRVIAARHLTPHVDEWASVLAAHAVAERGLPILPSGTVYFQGATLSYLLAPLVWLGLGDLRELEAMRFASVLAGSAAVYLAYRLGRAVAGDSRVGLITALLVALDPVSVQWSGHVRMYGLLQALSLALGWVFVLILVRPFSWRTNAALIGLFWAAVFTHVGAALLWPAMALVAVAAFRTSLLSRRRGLTGSLALSALAPAALVALNRLLGPAGVGGNATSPGASGNFVGDNLLAPLARLGSALERDDVRAVVADRNLAWLAPGLLVAVSTLIAAWHFLAGPDAERDARRRCAIGAVLALYWLPVIAVGAFTVSPNERYLLHVHLVGYVLVAALAVELTDRGCRAGQPTWRKWPAAIAVHGFAPVVVLTLAAGLIWRLGHPVVHPDHAAAMAYVGEYHEPGEPIVVALPAIAYLVLGDGDDLLFLAGPQDRSRAQRYTRHAGDGDLIDFWVGVDAIVSTAELHRTLAAHPDAWIVVDDRRLTADWAYAGEMEGVLRELTYPIHVAPGGAVVLRVLPPVDMVGDQGR